jgi:NitT/TauT family transport system permease protein
MSFVQRNLTWFTTPALVAIFLVLWDLYCRWSGIHPFIVPRPMLVVEQYVVLLQKKSLWMHTYITVYETLVGFLFACIIGIGGGALLGKITWLEETLRPFVIATQVIPKIALVSLFILWFGFGSEPKILVSTILAFFPILTNTLLGVKSVDLGHKDVMKSLNASRWQTFSLLELRSALPAIIAGLEVGIVLAYIGAIVGEFAGGTQGLGYLTLEYQNQLNAPGLFGVLIQLTVIGFVLYLTIIVMRRTLIPWHESVLIERPQHVA